MDFAKKRLVDIQYDRNQMSFIRGKFRVQGDVLEVFPAYEETAIRIEWWGDTIERITRFDPITGEVLGDLPEITIYPASHYVASDERMKHAIVGIEEELQERLALLESAGQAPRGRAPADAHQLRPRDAPGGRVLLGHRELLAPHRRPPARGGPVHAAGLLPRRLALRAGRVARDRAPDPRDVRRRQDAEGDAGRVRLPPAERAGQPAAAIRGVHEEGEPDRLHVGDAQPVRAPDVAARGRADRPAHGADRPGSPGPPDEGAGGRPDRGDPPPCGGRPAGPGHHAHEEDGRGSDRLPARDGGPGPVPALGGGHDPADPDHPRPAAR